MMILCVPFVFFDYKSEELKKASGDHAGRERRANGKLVVIQG